MTTQRARHRRVLDLAADHEHGLRALEAHMLALMAFGTIVLTFVGNLPDGLFNWARPHHTPEGAISQTVVGAGF
jgi:hypothetical protein